MSERNGATLDSFQTLPFEVMENILSSIPDLPSLHSLHNASPHVASLLHEKVTLSVIFESILSRSPRQIRSMIRTIIHIHTYQTTSDTNPLPTSLDAFTNPFNDRLHGCQTIPRGYADIALPKTTPPSILCRVLGLSRRVHQVTHACLHSMISRSMSLRPVHLTDPRMSFRSGSFEQLEKKLKRAEARERPYQPIDCGPPSWIEEQRVARAVWRLVLFYEIRDAVVVRGLLEWSNDDVNRLQNLGANNFWDSLLVLDVDELRTVSEWANKNAPNQSLRPWENISASLSDNWTYCCPQITPFMTKEDRQKITDALNISSPGRSEFGTNYDSPLIFGDFDVFRPYGFAIWEIERMAGLGFMNCAHDNSQGASRPYMSRSSLFYTWRSILTEEQKKDLEMTQRARWYIC